ncbi:MAG: hypothetical protein KBD41_13750, partial [Saprospiraceae bacterium]|nr:hypothetical protein [Saprospiraceae bacterium]
MFGCDSNTLANLCINLSHYSRVFVHQDPGFNFVNPWISFVCLDQLSVPIDCKGNLGTLVRETKLVFAGPYKYYRNPMICAILLTQNKETIENNSKIIQLTSILIALEKEALELNGVSKPHPNH